MRRSVQNDEMKAADNAIVFSAVLDGQGGARELDEPAAGANLWVHVQSDHPLCAETLSKLGLTEPAAEMMTAPETRPRVVATDEALIVVMRGVNLAEQDDFEDLVSLRIWVAGKTIVTARKSQRYLMSVRDVRESLAAGKGPRDASEVVVQIVEKLAQRIGEVVDQNEDDLAAIEEAGIVKEHRQELVQLRRNAAQLKRYLTPQRDALDALTRVKTVFSETQLFEIREQLDRTTRYVEDLELARERAILMQEELRNELAEQQNQRMYVLSLVTAVFLPLSFLTGVFGMNVMGLPGLHNPRGFAVVAVSMLVIGIGVLVSMRLKRWF